MTYTLPVFFEGSMTIAGLLLLPMVVPGMYWQRVISIVCIYALLALSFDFLAHYVGLASLEPVADGDSGELLVTCSYTLKCYNNKPEETDKTYVEIDGKTWCRMGDYVCALPKRIKAIMVLKEDARGVGGTELIQWCRERLAAYKVPVYIEFRDMLPKSKVGKLLRREVRDDEIRRMSKSKPAT